MGIKTLMNSKKKVLHASAAMVLIAAVGGGIFAGSAMAPMTPAENLKIHEETYGKAPPMPTTEELQAELAALPPEGSGEEAELLKQQLVFAKQAEKATTP